MAIETPKTPNLKLELPDGTDYYNVGVSNENLQKIDAEAGEVRRELEKRPTFHILATVPWTTPNFP